MTTPSPTSDAAAGLPTDPVGPPAWLPDEATLNRLAGEFFSALPAGVGQIPVVAPGPAAALEPDVYPVADLAEPGLTLPAVSGTGPMSPVAGLGTGPLDAALATPSAGPYYFLPDGAARSETGPGTTPASATSAVAPEAPRPSDPSAGGFVSDAHRPADAYAAAGVPILPDTPRPPVGPSGFVPAGPVTAGPTFYFLRPASPEVAPVIPTGVGAAHPAFDVAAVRRDFPILAERVNGRPLVWLDNAATTQKPQCVIDRLGYFYAHENSNIHRAAHTLAARATDAYESARDTVARFIGAGSADEVVFVRGATEAINLVAQAWGGANIGAGDEIVVSHLEHHANLVPWQMLAQRTGAIIKVIGVDDRGQLLLDDYTRLLSQRTKLVAVTHVSNALGTITPVRQIAELAHRAGATVLVDGAQSVPHVPIDVRQLGADFFVFSGHKVFGPTGIGVLYGRQEILADMPPWQGGGNMITDVTLEGASYAGPPDRFEAGTGNIADAAGLAAALDYVQRIGLPVIAAYEHDLLEYATARLCEVPGLRLIGTADEKASVLSFVLEGFDPHEVGTALDKEGIAVRAGHHCAQPILRRMGVEATVRPSLAFYNTHAEADALVEALHRLGSRHLATTYPREDLIRRR